MVVLSTHTERTQIVVGDRQYASAEAGNGKRHRHGAVKNASPRSQEGITMHPLPQHPQAPRVSTIRTHEHDACGVGFVVNIKGEQIARHRAEGLQVLDNLTHRGACGCDPRTGDGAGILMQIPHEFFVREAEQARLRRCRRRANTASGSVFLPLEPERRNACEEIFERVIREEGQQLLGWRTVPIDRQRMRRHRAAADCRRFARSSSGAAQGMPTTRRRSSASSTSFASASPTRARTMRPRRRRAVLLSAASRPRPSFTRAS